MTYTNSTPFWQIWYPNVSLVFADYIHTWTNLNPVINARSLESAKEDSKTYFASKRVQPCCFRDLRTVDELTRIPRFASFFRISALVVSSFLRICWSMKALASIDSFFGLPGRGKFATEPVRRRFGEASDAWKAHLLSFAFQGFKYSSWMEALAIQELDSSSSIAWYFWHNNYQSATRSMNEWMRELFTKHRYTMRCHGCDQFTTRFLAWSLAYKLGISCVVIWRSYSQQMAPSLSSTCLECLRGRFYLDSNTWLFGSHQQSNIRWGFNRKER